MALYEAYRKSPYYSDYQDWETGKGPYPPILLMQKWGGKGLNKIDSNIGTEGFWYITWTMDCLCSECGEVLPLEVDCDTTDYCPICGAHMRTLWANGHYEPEPKTYSQMSAEWDKKYKGVEGNA